MTTSRIYTVIETTVECGEETCTELLYSFESEDEAKAFISGLVRSFNMRLRAISDRLPVKARKPAWQMVDGVFTLIEPYTRTTMTVVSTELIKEGEHDE